MNYCKITVNFLIHTWFHIYYHLDRKVSCTEGEVRLLGGPDKFSGILTVCFNGALTLVCERNFDYRDANVVCRQAGFVDRGILLVTVI